VCVRPATVRTATTARQTAPSTVVSTNDCRAIHGFAVRTGSSVRYRADRIPPRTVAVGMGFVGSVRGVITVHVTVVFMIVGVVGLIVNVAVEPAGADIVLDHRMKRKREMAL